MTETMQLTADQRSRALHTIQGSVFCVSFPFGILGFVLPILGQEIGANAIEIGLFFSAFSLMTVLARPVVGAGLDRHGRRRFFLAGLLGYALTWLAFTFVHEVWAIVLARTVQGIASSLVWLSARAMTADTAAAEARGYSFGSVEQSSHQGALIGTSIGFAVLVLLGGRNGWSTLFIGYALLTVLAAWLAWRRLPETNPRLGRAVLRPIVWSRPWLLLLLVTAVTGASAAMISPILIIFLQERLGVQVRELALAYLPAALIWALLPGRLGRLADRFGRKPLMLWGLVVAAASSLAIPRIGCLLGLAAVWALQGLCYAAGDPAEQALVADLSGGDQRGRAFGLYTLAAGLGETVGPLVGGWLYEAVGSAAPFLANGMVLAACALVLAALLQVPARGG